MQKVNKGLEGIRGFNSTFEGCGTYGLCKIGERCVDDLSMQLGFKCLPPTTTTTPPPPVDSGNRKFLKTLLKLPKLVNLNIRRGEYFGCN